MWEPFNIYISNQFAVLGEHFFLNRLKYAQRGNQIFHYLGTLKVIEIALKINNSLAEWFKYTLDIDALKSDQFRVVRIDFVYLYIV